MRGETRTAIRLAETIAAHRVAAASACERAIERADDARRRGVPIRGENLGWLIVELDLIYEELTGMLCAVQQLNEFIRQQQSKQTHNDYILKEEP